MQLHEGLAAEGDLPCGLHGAVGVVLLRHFGVEISHAYEIEFANAEGRTCWQGVVPRECLRALTRDGFE